MSHSYGYCGLVSLLLCTAPGWAGPPVFEEQNLYVAGEYGYTRFRIPSLITTSQGTVLAFAEARKGEGHDWSEIDLVLRRSDDHGKTWQPLQMICDEGASTMNQPCPVFDRETGVLWFAYCKNNRQVFVKKSTDEGAHWSSAVEITEDVTAPEWKYCGSGPGHGIQLRSGRLMIPSWGDTSPGPAEWPSKTWGAVQFSYVFYSDDHGNTWKMGEVLDNDMSDECELVEATDGSLYMNMRSRQERNCRAYARSSDGGETWSKVEFDTTLPEPSCQAGMTRYSSSSDSSKSRILLSHPSSPSDRAMLTLRLSYDEGHAWPVSRVVHQGTAAYSDLTVAADKSILCLYESDQGRVQSANNTLTLARMNLEWLSQGKDSP